MPWMHYLDCRGKKQLVIAIVNHFMVTRVSYRIFGLGGEIYWCINEARKCERRGLGYPLPGPPRDFLRIWPP